mgnify:CR=1 FL=1
MKGELSYANLCESQKEQTDVTETEGVDEEDEETDGEDTEGDERFCKESDGESGYKEIIDWAKESIAKYDSTKH